MRLASFTADRVTRIGVVVSDSVIDLSRVAPRLPSDMTAFLEGGAHALEEATRAMSRLDAAIPLRDVRLEPPVPRPRKFLGLGANYPGKTIPSGIGERASQMRSQSDQVWFNKQVSCITGPFDPIVIPQGCGDVLHEAELALVIGKRCRHVPKDRAGEVIAGYFVCNDVTVVEWVLRSMTVTLGKSFDTHGPIGPWIVTPDELGDPHDLRLRSFVNGEERQSARTSEMYFDCFDMVAYLSSVFTLEPGDILTTGTPARSPGSLRAGDVVCCEIEGIGRIENRAVSEA